MYLKGKTSIITGSSRGIGKAILLKLTSNGSNVVINYVNQNEEIIEEIKEKCNSFGVRAISVKSNVSNFDEAKELIDRTIEEFGNIDILVNNAGITRDNLLLRMSEKDFDDVINTNLKGAFNCTRHAIYHMIRKRSGSIINIASIVGIAGNAGQSNYSASKAGIIGFTKSCAKEAASRGITVNAVAPGFIETDMTNILNDELKQKAMEMIPLKRFGKPDDVASLVCFLASDYGKYITGQVVNIDGGMLM